MTTKGMAIVALLIATPALQGCDIFETVLKSSGATDSVAQMRDSGPYTAGSEVVAEIIQAEQPPAPAPVCEDIRWRYKIYTCDWVDTGRTYE
jgi:hypothetical protein